MIITRGLDKNPKLSDWIQNTMANHGADSASPNITLTVLDNKKKPVRRVEFRNAWASDWTEPALYAGRSKPSTEAVTITYEEATVSGS